MSNSNGNSNHDQQFETVAVFDRILGGLDGVPGVDKTPASTLIALVDVVGKASTFIVQTYRRRDEGDVQLAPGQIDRPMDRAGDTIFVQHIDANGSYRFVLPPIVADTIARQRDLLTAKGRRRGARAAAETRKARGVVAGFAALSPAQLARARRLAQATRQKKAAARAARKAAKAAKA